MVTRHVTASVSLASACVLAGGLVLTGSLVASAQVSGINPVRINEAAPVNSGFVVVVEGDTSLNPDESEGTIATGGNLFFNTSYNVGIFGPLQTPTTPGDPVPVALWVGGGIQWPDAGYIVSVQQGTTKVADTSTYTG